MLTLRERGMQGWTNLAGAFVAVFLGVAVVALTGLLYACGTAQVPQRIANASIVVQSQAVHTLADPFPQTRPWPSAAATALAERLATVTGVDAAVPDRTFYAQAVIDGHVVAGQAEGYGWSSMLLGPRRLVAGAAPQRAGEVVLDRALGLSPGAPVTLLTATGPTPYTVSGVVDGPGLYVADTEAVRLAPGVRAIGLIGQPNKRVVADVTAIVGGDGQVLTGADRSALEPRADATTRWIGSQVLAAMAALAAFVSVFVVASTFAFNVNQRRRELGLLRAIGAVPRQIRQLLYCEALAVGVAASAAGVLLGAALAPTLGGVLVDAGFEPAGYQVRAQLWPIAAAFAVGPVVALLGVWTASRRAAQVRPLEALREATVQTRPMTRVRWILGGLFTAGGVATGIATAATTDTQDMATFSLLGTMTLVVAATLFAPAVIPALVRMLTWPLARTRGATVMLVRESALTAVRRTASTATPVLLTVTFAVLIAGNVQTTTSAYAAARNAAVRASAVITPDGTPGLSDAAIAAVPGAALLKTSVYVADTVVPALGVDPAAFAGANNRLTVLSGDLNDLRGDDTVVVTRSTATKHNWQQGGVAPVTLVDGSVVLLRVVAVVSDASAPAGLLLPRAAVRRHDPSALTSAVFLSGPPPTGPMIGGRVVDVATYAAQADTEENHLVWIFTLLLIGVSAGYGAITVANTLLMATAQRTRDFRVLQRSGATTRQVCLAVAAESALVVAIGSALGGAVAAAALWGGVAALREQAGAHVELVVPWPTISAVVATCLLLAVTASVVPARLALRSR